MGYGFHAYSNDYWCKDVPLDYQFNLVCDRTLYASYSQTAYMLGYILSGLVLSHYSDKYGRRPIIWVAFTFEIVGILACVLAPNIYLYSLARFVVACAGHALVPGLAYWLQDYRFMQLVSVVVLVLMVFWYYYMFESPRWLITNGYVDRAEHTLRKALKMNGKSDENLTHQLTELSDHLKQLQSKEKPVKNITVLDILKTPTLRKITLILWYLSIVLAILYYALSFNMADYGGNFYITYLLSGLVGLPAQLITVLLMRFIGRRKLLAIFMLIASMASLAVIPSRSDWLKVTWALVSKFGVGSAWNMMYIMEQELYPTVLRQRGIGAASVVGRIGAIGGPFMKDLVSFFRHMP
ncbi:unnamed protein product [Oppiella nova]|uniref:Organic cation transporter protein n=1 Tax=Oppiella nova TaxID=334625 RepID=A0A7R9QFN2_9ACAR|nr:unnamed protein product [Oppiella nova]CAG2164959.1 unnamed protein product [Oppiella nova]